MDSILLVRNIVTEALQPGTINKELRTGVGGGSQFLRLLLMVGTNHSYRCYYKRDVT